MKRQLLIIMILLAAATAMAQKHVSDLVVTPAFSGGTIKWYTASSGANEITSPSTTALADGTTYYASQTVNGVESTARKAVTVTLSTTTAIISETWVTSINSTSSQFNMTINVTNAIVTGYKYSTTSGFDPATSGTDVSNITTPTTYTGQNPTNFVSGLSAGTIYYVRAYATNACGTSYGNEMNFIQLAIGDTYQGGTIFYILQGGDPNYNKFIQRGLIAAPTDYSGYVIWSNVTSTLVGTSSNLGTGLANTNAIIGQSGHTTSAAKICHDLVVGSYNDWYLPSRDEFSKLKLNYLAAGITLTYLVTGSGNDGYWTSSEFNDTYAYIWFQTEASYNTYTKNSYLYVRAIRSF